MSGNFLLIYICNLHVLSDLLLIYICKLHWNRLPGSDARVLRVRSLCLGPCLRPLASRRSLSHHVLAGAAPPKRTPVPLDRAVREDQVHFLLVYICSFHVLNHLLLIYICKLHWNLNTMFLCQVNYL